MSVRYIPHGAGGARRDRTDDPLLAKQVLSQLSYGPVLAPESASRPGIPYNGLLHGQSAHGCAGSCEGLA